MKNYRIGIDAGGTYTDVVVVDSPSGEVIFSVKELTTHGQLEHGIISALNRLFPKGKKRVRPTEISLVSLSSTLATNAVVEGKGAPTAVFLIGFTGDMVARTRLDSLVPPDSIVRIAGGHRYDGKEREPLNVDTLRKFLEDHAEKYQAFSATSHYSVRNSEHELLAQSVIGEYSGKHITISSSLTQDLNSPRRALTATLNAAIQPLMHSLVRAMETAMRKLKIEAPLMIVRGDGSIIPAPNALDRPIETMGSGPAASVIGANTMTGLSDFLISDIGGTTTDMAIVRQGWPVVEPRGSLMAGYRTSIKTIRIHSHGLGGDSECVDECGKEVEVRINRVVPVSLMAHRFPELIEVLQKRSRENFGLYGALQYIVLAGDSKPEEVPMTSDEAELLKRFSPEPVAYDNFSGRAWNRMIIGRLLRKGLIQISGLTLSDAAHALGLQDNWSREAACHALTINDRWNGRVSWNDKTREQEIRGYAKKILDAVIAKSTYLALETLSRQKLEKDSSLLETFLDGNGMLEDLSVEFRSVLPIVAVGGPADTVYPEVGHRLKTKTVIPENHAVANAIGAASGMVRITAMVEITNPESNGFILHVGNQVTVFTDPDEALKEARKAARTLIQQQSRAMGLKKPEIQIEEKFIRVPGTKDNEGLVSAVIRANSIVKLI